MKTPDDMLSDQEIKNQKANSCIRWAAGRAFALALFPLTSDVPFLANEAYMFYRLGGIYGYKTDQKLLSSFWVVLGLVLDDKFCVRLHLLCRHRSLQGLPTHLGKPPRHSFNRGCL